MCWPAAEGVVASEVFSLEIEGWEACCHADLGGAGVNKADTMLVEEARAEEARGDLASVLSGRGHGRAGFEEAVAFGARRGRGSPGQGRRRCLPR
jgi:hypothetical protein